MPLDNTAAVTRSIQTERPFVAYRRPPRLVVVHEDEVALSALEAGWSGQRGTIAAADDDLSDRWNDDEPPAPRLQRRGVDMDELAASAVAFIPDLPGRTTLRALMVAAGHMTHVPKERRYLLSAAAIREGIGQNVRPRRGFRFPVIFPENVATILRSLDWRHIKARVAALPTCRERREYLARWHSTLPTKTLADLAGCSVRTMERALAQNSDD